MFALLGAAGGLAWQPMLTRQGHSLDDPIESSEAPALLQVAS